MSPLNQGYLKPPLIYLTPVKKWEVLISLPLFYLFFFVCFFIFLTSAAMATITGVRTCVNVCDWLAVIWCSYGNHRWNGDCREWLFYLFQSVQLKSETTWYESWFDFFFFFPFFSSWTYVLAIFFSYSCCRFKTTNLYPVGLIIPKIMMHPFSTHSSSFKEGLEDDFKSSRPSKR